MLAQTLPLAPPADVLTLLSTGHIFGKSTRKEFCYDNIHISRNAWDTNLVKVRAGPSDQSMVALGGWRAD